MVKLPFCRSSQKTSTTSRGASRAKPIFLCAAWIPNFATCGSYWIHWIDKKWHRKIHPFFNSAKHLFRLGPSKNHGELLTNNQMLCFWQMGLKLHFYRISMAFSWDSHPMDPWPLSETVLFSNPLVVKAQSHFLSEATAGSIGSIFDGMWYRMGPPSDVCWFIKPIITPMN